MLQPPPLLLLDRLRLLGPTFLVLGGLESVEGHVARHLVREVELAQRQLLCVVANLAPVVLDDGDLHVALVRAVIGRLSLARAERDQLVGVHLVLNLGCRGGDPSSGPDAQVSVVLASGAVEATGVLKSPLAASRGAPGRLPCFLACCSLHELAAAQLFQPLQDLLKLLDAVAVALREPLVVEVLQLF